MTSLSSNSIDGDSATAILDDEDQSRRQIIPNECALITGKQNLCSRI
jgi:hypothetical protein